MDAGGGGPPAGGVPPKKKVVKVVRKKVVSRTSSPRVISQTSSPRALPATGVGSGVPSLGGISAAADPPRPAARVHASPKATPKSTPKSTPASRPAASSGVRSTTAPPSSTGTMSGPSAKAPPRTRPSLERRVVPSAALARRASALTTTDASVARQVSQDSFSTTTTATGTVVTDAPAARRREVLSTAGGDSAANTPLSQPTQAPDTHRSMAASNVSFGRLPTAMDAQSPRSDIVSEQEGSHLSRAGSRQLAEQRRTVSPESHVYSTPNLSYVSSPAPSASARTSITQNPLAGSLDMGAAVAFASQNPGNQRVHEQRVYAGGGERAQLRLSGTAKQLRLTQSPRAVEGPVAPRTPRSGNTQGATDAGAGEASLLETPASPPADAVRRERVVPREDDAAAAPAVPAPGAATEHTEGGGEKSRKPAEGASQAPPSATPAAAVDDSTGTAKTPSSADDAAPPPRGPPPPAASSSESLSEDRRGGVQPADAASPPSAASVVPTGASHASPREDADVSLDDMCLSVSVAVDCAAARVRDAAAVADPVCPAAPQRSPSPSPRRGSSVPASDLLTVPRGGGAPLEEAVVAGGSTVDAGKVERLEKVCGSGRFTPPVPAERKSTGGGESRPPSPPPSRTLSIGAPASSSAGGHIRADVSFVLSANGSVDNESQAQRKRSAAARRGEAAVQSPSIGAQTVSEVNTSFDLSCGVLSPESQTHGSPVVPPMELDGGGRACSAHVSSKRDPPAAESSPERRPVGAQPPPLRGWSAVNPREASVATAATEPQAPAHAGARESGGGATVGEKKKEEEEEERGDANGVDSDDSDELEALFQAPKQSLLAKVESAASTPRPSMRVRSDDPRMLSPRYGSAMSDTQKKPQEPVGVAKGHLSNSFNVNTTAIGPVPQPKTDDPSSHSSNGGGDSARASGRLNAGGGGGGGTGLPPRTPRKLEVEPPPESGSGTAATSEGSPLAVQARRGSLEFPKPKPPSRVRSPQAASVPRLPNVQRHDPPPPAPTGAHSARAERPEGIRNAAARPPLTSRKHVPERALEVDAVLGSPSRRAATCGHARPVPPVGMPRARQALAAGKAASSFGGLPAPLLTAAAGKSPVPSPRRAPPARDPPHDDVPTTAGAGGAASAPTRVPESPKPAIAAAASAPPPKDTAGTPAAGPLPAAASAALPPTRGRERRTTFADVVEKVMAANHAEGERERRRSGAEAMGFTALNPRVSGAVGRWGVYPPRHGSHARSSAAGSIASTLPRHVHAGLRRSSRQSVGSLHDSLEGSRILHVPSFVRSRLGVANVPIQAPAVDAGDVPSISVAAPSHARLNDLRRAASRGGAGAMFTSVGVGVGAGRLAAGDVPLAVSRKRLRRDPLPPPMAAGQAPGQAPTHLTSPGTDTLHITRTQSLESNAWADTSAAFDEIMGGLEIASICSTVNDDGEVSRKSSIDLSAAGVSLPKSVRRRAGSACAATPRRPSLVEHSSSFDIHISPVLTPRGDTADAQRADIDARIKSTIEEAIVHHHSRVVLKLDDRFDYAVDCGLLKLLRNRRLRTVIVAYSKLTGKQIQTLTRALADAEQLRRFNLVHSTLVVSEAARAAAAAAAKGGGAGDANAGDGTPRSVGSRRGSVPASDVLPRPSGVSWAVAQCIVVVAFTATYILRMVYFIAGCFKSATSGKSEALFTGGRARSRSNATPQLAPTGNGRPPPSPKGTQTGNRECTDHTVTPDDVSAYLTASWLAVSAAVTAAKSAVERGVRACRGVADTTANANPANGGRTVSPTHVNGRVHENGHGRGSATAATADTKKDGAAGLSKKAQKQIKKAQQQQQQKKAAALPPKSPPMVPGSVGSAPVDPPSALARVSNSFAQLFSSGGTPSVESAGQSPRGTPTLPPTMSVVSPADTSLDGSRRRVPTSETLMSPPEGHLNRSVSMLQRISSLFRGFSNERRGSAWGKGAAEDDEEVDACDALLGLIKALPHGVRSISLRGTTFTAPPVDVEYLASLADVLAAPDVRRLDITGFCTPAKGGAGGLGAQRARDDDAPAWGLFFQRLLSTCPALEALCVRDIPLRGFDAKRLALLVRDLRSLHEVDLRGTCILRDAEAMVWLMDAVRHRFLRSDEEAVRGFEDSGADTALRVFMSDASESPAGEWEGDVDAGGVDTGHRAGAATGRVNPWLMSSDEDANLTLNETFRPFGDGSPRDSPVPAGNASAAGSTGSPPQTPAPAASVVPMSIDRGWTILHYAAFLDRPELAIAAIAGEPLLVSRRDRYGRTPLHLAAAAGSILSLRPMLEALSEHSRERTEVIVNYKDDNGMTALYEAAARCHMNCTAALTEAGAEVDHTCLNTAIQLLNEHNHCVASHAVTHGSVDMASGRARRTRYTAIAEGHTRKPNEGRFDEVVDHRDCVRARRRVREQLLLLAPAAQAPIRRVALKAFLPRFLLYLCFLLVVTFTAAGLSTDFISDNSRATKSLRDRMEGVETLQGVQAEDLPDLLHITTVNELWVWWEKVLLSVINDALNDEGLEVVRAVRLRQVRVVSKPCPAETEDRCYGRFRPSKEDRTDLVLKFGNGTEKAWAWEESETSAAPLRSQIGLSYGNGGYVEYVHSADVERARRKVLMLRELEWIDDATRAVFMDLTFFKRNSNQHIACHLLFEIPAAGEVIHSFSIVPIADPLNVRLLSLLAGLYLCLCVLIYLEYRDIQNSIPLWRQWVAHLRQKCRKVSSFEVRKMYARLVVGHFFQSWNACDVCIIIMLIVSFSDVMTLVSETLVKQEEISEEHKFLSFETLSVTTSRLRDKFGLLVVAAWFKTLKFISILPVAGPAVNAITSTVFSPNILTFLTLFVIVAFAFSIGLHITLGNYTQSFSSVTGAGLSFFRMVFGDFDISNFDTHTTYVGLFLFMLCLVCANFVLMNILIAMVGMHYEEELRHCTTSWQKDMIRLLQHDLANKQAEGLHAKRSYLGQIMYVLNDLSGYHGGWASEDQIVAKTLSDVKDGRHDTSLHYIIDHIASEYHGPPTLESIQESLYDVVQQQLALQQQMLRNSAAAAAEEQQQQIARMQEETKGFIKQAAEAAAKAAVAGCRHCQPVYNGSAAANGVPNGDASAKSASTSPSPAKSPEDTAVFLKPVADADSDEAAPLGRGVLGRERTSSLTEMEASWELLHTRLRRGLPPNTWGDLT